MTIRVTHAKVNQVADWTQSKLDELINAGIYPQGTLITDITLPSDWNDDHTSTDLDYLEDNVRGAVIVDMDSDDHTMTIAEAVASIKVIVNPGTNKTLTFPTTADALIPAVNTFITIFAGGPFTVASETGGTTSEVVSDTSDQLYVIPGTSVSSEYNDYISQDAYDVSWDVNNRAPTQKEMYSILTGGHQVGPLKLKAGTATANTQPLEIASGTLMTSPEAGSIEYDGKALYATPTATARGISPAMFFIRNSADFLQSDVNTAQDVFEAARNSITLESDTTYFFKGLYVITRAAGTTAHTTGTLFAGTATFTSFFYETDASTLGGAGTNTVTRAWSSDPTTVRVSSASSSAATEHLKMQVEGVMSVNAGGTFIPQFQFSAAPGGAPTVVKNSYFQWYAVGDGTVAQVGAAS
jgi:hypothetical protein